ADDGGQPLGLDGDLLGGAGVEHLGGAADVLEDDAVLHAHLLDVEGAAVVVHVLVYGDSVVAHDEGGDAAVRARDDVGEDILEHAVSPHDAAAPSSLARGPWPGD